MDQPGGKTLGDPDGSSWQRAYDDSIRAEGNRLSDAGDSPGGCLRDLVLDFFGGPALAAAICAGGLALVAGFKARPGVTSAVTALALVVGWYVAWRASRNRIAAALIILAAISAAIAVYLPSCRCG